MTIAITLLLSVVTVADTTTLSLQQAINLLRERNPMMAAEQASARAARAGVGMASPAFLPSLTLGVDAVRTTDPVAVFGMKLRQENFQGADLALDPLNRPSPYGGFSFQANLQQPIFSPEGIFGYRAASSQASSMEAMARHVGGVVVSNLVRAYWGTKLSDANVAMLESAHATALAHAEQADALHQEGLTTGLDARLARVGAADIEARLISARANAMNARSTLLAMLDLPGSTHLNLSDPLNVEQQSSCEVGSCELRRADIEAAQAAVDASGFAVKQAWSTNLPAVVAFANVATYGQNGFSGSGDWTVGIAVKWNPFRGTAGTSAIGQARAVRDVHRERLRALTAQSQMAITAAERLLEANRQRHRVARAALVEANEALAQATLRYSTGVSAITELLDVQTARNAAELNLLTAVHDVLVARANIDFAYGVFDQ